MQIIFISMLIDDYQIIFATFTFKKSKTTCPFNGNEASKLSYSYLTGLLTKLPGEHIPLLQASCLVSKPVEEACVSVLA